MLYVDIKFNDPSILKHTAHVDFNDKNPEKVRFVEVNSMSAVVEHLTAKYYDDRAICNSVDESSLWRLNPDEKNEIRWTRFYNFIFFLTSPKTIIETATKTRLDSLSENDGNRLDLSALFVDPDNLVDIIMLNNLDSITVNRNPNTDYELSHKTHVDVDLDRNTIFRFNQSPQKYLKVTLGNNKYSRTLFDRFQIPDATINEYLNRRWDLLQQWKKECNYKNGNGKIATFVKSSLSTTPTGSTGATSIYVYRYKCH